MNAMARMPPEEFSRAQLNLETAQIGWRELQPYFARGATLLVGADLDLVEVAYQVSRDNATQVAQWMEAGQISRVSDQQALAWYEADAVVWAVVARPYVLVQESRNVLHR
ncbi:MAG: DUF2288 family protein [Sideroxydans sp.]